MMAGFWSFFPLSFRNQIANIWVKELNTDDDVFRVSVDSIETLDFCRLKEEILKKRTSLNYPVDIIKYVYTSKDGTEMNRCNVGEKVPTPVRGQPGYSCNNPYYFSVIKQKQAEGSLLKKHLLFYCKLFTNFVFAC